MALVQQPELNARQRKHVYMHSTIFDSQGPESKSVYAPGRQAELYKQVEQSSKKGAPQHAPDLDLPRPADIKCTQLRGSGCIQPSGSHKGQRWGAPAPSGYPSAHSPRQSGPQALVSDGEVIPVVPASRGEQEHIPKEFWATSVNLQWNDTRNEMSRPKSGTGVDRKNINHQDMKRQEMSSELFGQERQCGRSTDKPRKELMPVTADLIEFDSSVDPKVKASRPADDHQTRVSKTASRRMQDNLTHSEHHPLGQHNWREEQPQNMSYADEDPAGADRRRSEKNFSDLFGHQMGERREIRGQREEVNATRTCSFLDTRSEIGNRNKEKWRVDESQKAAHRKEAQIHNSRLFGHDEPDRPPTQRPEPIEAHHLERSCWDTKDIMHTGSEIARRRRLKEFDGVESHTAVDRKQEDLASRQIRMATGASPPVQHSPRMARSPGAGRMDRRVNAKDTKLASLQSSIFS